MVKKTKKGKRVKKRQKSKVDILKAKLWKVFSWYVRSKSNGICFTCGRWHDPRELDAGHYIHGRLDYDEININAQCTYCNRFLHGNLGVYGEKLIEKYGLERIQELRREANQAKKYTIDELEDLIAHYQRKTIELLE